MKQKLTIFSQTYGFYLFPMVALVVVAFLFINNDLPLIEKLINLREENTNIQKRLSGLTAKLNLLQESNEKELEEKDQKLKFILPDGKDAPSILRTLDQAASVSAVTILDLDLSPGILATESGKQSEIPIKVTVSGSLSQITDFTDQLMDLGRAISLKTLEIVLDNAALPVKASYEIRAFYLFPSLVVSKVDDPLWEINPNEKETLSRVLKRSLLVPQTILLPSPKVDLFK